MSTVWELPLSATCTGTISLRKRPSSMAAIAFSWLLKAKRSCSSRLMPYFMAMRLADSPCGMIS